MKGEFGPVFRSRDHGMAARPNLEECEGSPTGASGTYTVKPDPNEHIGHALVPVDIDIRPVRGRLHKWNLRQRRASRSTRIFSDKKRRQQCLPQDCFQGSPVLGTRPILNWGMPNQFMITASRKRLLSLVKGHRRPDLQPISRLVAGFNHESHRANTTSDSGSRSPSSPASKRLPGKLGGRCGSRRSRRAPKHRRSAVASCRP